MLPPPLGLREPMRLRRALRLLQKEYESQDRPTERMEADIAEEMRAASRTVRGSLEAFRAARRSEGALLARWGVRP